MKRVFMRALWGIHDDSNRILARRSRADKHIQQALTNPHGFDFITYVFGEDNYKSITSMGIKNCILIDKNPAPFKLIGEQYRHKLEAIRYAMEVDGYDEMIHLDWDCYPVKKIPIDFWNIMGKKEAFQSCLFLFKHKKCPWRSDFIGTDVDKWKAKRLVPNGGFVYIRNKDYPSRIIKMWEKLRGNSAEPPMAMFVDELMGNWKGMEEYWNLYEAPTCRFSRKNPYPADKMATKDIHFIHHFAI